LKDSSKKTLITIGYWKTWQNVFAVSSSAFWKLQNLNELPLSSYQDGVKKNGEGAYRNWLNSSRRTT
jgi:hypothetical protein